MISYRKFFSIIAPWILLALSMNLLRYFMNDVASYIYMNWNLFLGLLPLLFAWMFLKNTNIFVQTGLFFAWLFFLPNAIYMVTDLIHLRDVGTNGMLWFDGMMIFSYTLVGVYAAVYSLTSMQRALFKNTKHQHIFLGIISLISSFGIYLGRYVRFNSWDVVSNPIGLTTGAANVIVHNYTEPIFIMTIIFFTLFMYIATISFKNIFTD